MLVTSMSQSVPPMVVPAPSKMVSISGCVRVPPPASIRSAVAATPASMSMFMTFPVTAPVRAMSMVSPEDVPASEIPMRSVVRNMAPDATTMACEPTAVAPRATLIASPVSVTAPKFKSIIFPDEAAVAVVISITFPVVPPVISTSIVLVSGVPVTLI